MMTFFLQFYFTLFKLFIFYGDTGQQNLVSFTCTEMVTFLNSGILRPSSPQSRSARLWMITGCPKTMFCYSDFHFFKQSIIPTYAFQSNFFVYFFVCQKNFPTPFFYMLTIPIENVVHFQANLIKVVRSHCAFQEMLNKCFSLSISILQSQFGATPNQTKELSGPPLNTHSKNPEPKGFVFAHFYCYIYSNLAYF